MKTNKHCHMGRTLTHSRTGYEYTRQNIQILTKILDCLSQNCLFITKYKICITKIRQFDCLDAGNFNRLSTNTMGVDEKYLGYIFKYGHIFLISSKYNKSEVGINQFGN